MLVPDLPLDVIYVIGCHLAGIHAFGTLASLHLANHAVAETVLPVLYETLFLTNLRRIPSGVECEGELQKGALHRYTK
jgi:hypothetical protein